jgi:hypothetical protein
MGILSRVARSAGRGLQAARNYEGGLEAPSLGALASHSGLGGFVGGVAGGAMSPDDPAGGFANGAMIGAGGAAGLRLGARALGRLGAGISEAAGGGIERELAESVVEAVQRGGPQAGNEAMLEIQRRFGVEVANATGDLVQRKYPGIAGYPR